MATLTASEREALSIAQRVGDLIAKVTGREPPPGMGEAPATMIDAGPNYSDAVRGLELGATVSSIQARARAVREMWEFFKTEPMVEDGLELLGYLSARPGRPGRPFEITFPVQDTAGPAEKARALELQRMVTATMDRRASLLEGGPGVSLRRKIPRMLTYALLEGQRHFEMVVDWNGLRSDISELKYIPGPREGKFLRRLTDPDSGKLVGYALMNLQTLTYERTFRPWQVMTLTWGDLCHDGTEPWGLIQSSRTIILRLRQMYEDAATARHDKAYSKFIHKYPGASDEDLMKKALAMDRLRRKRGGGGVLADLYTNGDIQPHDPANVQLSRMGDVEMIQNILMSQQKVPKGLRAGYGEGLPRATLDRQIEVTNYICDNVCLMGTEGIERFVDLRLILAGEDPAAWPYVVAWTPKEVDTYAEKAKALALLVTSRVVARRRAQIDLQLDPDQEEAWLADEEAMGQPLPTDRGAGEVLQTETNAGVIESVLAQVDGLLASGRGDRKGALRAILEEAFADAA